MLFRLKQSHKIIVVSFILLSPILFVRQTVIAIANWNKDAGVSANIIYVDKDATGGGNNGSSWTNAYLTVQSAIDVAAPGDEIWVAEGVYTPTTGITRTATFTLANGVELYGGFNGTETAFTQRDWEENLTILSGDLDGNDITVNGMVTNTENITGSNAYHVVTGSGTDSSAVLDGFAITAGNADGSFTDPCTAVCGGGIYNAFGDPTLSNLIIKGNLAFFEGGGMYNLESAPTLNKVTLSKNRARFGGAIYNIFSSPLLENVILNENLADYNGGGIYNNNFSTP